MQQNNNQQQQQYRNRINKYIRVPEVRLIDENNNNVGVIKTYQALELAQSKGLDLVQVNNGNPPTCKIMDYGKYLFDLKKQQKQAKKASKALETKQIELRPNTSEYDLGYKIDHAKTFLQEGHKVKFVVNFKGRELTHTDLGKEKLNYILDQIKDLIQAIPSISAEGKQMSILVMPKK